MKHLSSLRLGLSLGLVLTSWLSLTGCGAPEVQASATAEEALEVTPSPAQCEDRVVREFGEQPCQYFEDGVWKPSSTFCERECTVDFRRDFESGGGCVFAAYRCEPWACEKCLPPPAH